ncbi:hypothetical protein ACVGW2_13020, partial [Enterobacter intestinihominis]
MNKKNYILGVAAISFYQHMVFDPLFGGRQTRGKKKTLKKRGVRKKKKNRPADKKNTTGLILSFSLSC